MSTIDWPSPPQYPTTCPHCGHCPTCGRGGYHAAPWYPYWPLHEPYWTWTSGGTAAGRPNLTVGTCS